MRPLFSAFLWVGLTACGPTTGTPTSPDAASDGPAADRCIAADLAPPPPGCRFVNPEPCTGRRTLVCDDGGVDAPQADAAPDTAADVADAAVDAPADRPTDVPSDTSADVAISCGSGGAASFPTFSSSCNADGDCVVGVHQTDCCGNQRGLGLAASQRAAFEAAEAICRPMYPRCGCPTRGVLCDDDRWTFGADTIGVACRASRCTTFVR